MHHGFRATSFVIPAVVAFVLFGSQPHTGASPASTPRVAAPFGAESPVPVRSLGARLDVSDYSPAQDGGDSQGRVRRPPDSGASQPPKQGEPRAVPRDQPRAKTESPRNDDRDRPQRGGDHREPPRRADVPQRYFAVPHVYAFEPVDPRVGYYYHPYFGFYVGPYYGPFYPYPGPFPRFTRYAVSSLRLKVKPVETAVYLNGYYAGIADDFDGIFQRLYVPAGGHHLELRLEGYESYQQDIYVSPGDTMEVIHQMVAARAGAHAASPPIPRSVPEEWSAEPRDLGQPASPYGILVVHTDPSDAQIVIDDEAWGVAAGQTELVIHLLSGSHRLEIHRDGYRAFSTTVELSPGQTTPVNVQLRR